MIRRLIARPRVRLVLVVVSLVLVLASGGHPFLIGSAVGVVLFIGLRRFAARHTLTIPFFGGRGRNDF